MSATAVDRKTRWSDAELEAKVRSYAVRASSDTEKPVRRFHRRRLVSGSIERSARQAYESRKLYERSQKSKCLSP